MFNIINRQNVASFRLIILSVILQLSKIVKKKPPRGGEERNIFLDYYYLNQIQIWKKVTFNMLILNYLSPSISIQINN